MSLAEILGAFKTDDPHEAFHLAQILDFVGRHPDPFDRRILEGHLTSSALVFPPSGDEVLLLWHRKLERWLQPGGHAEPGEDSGEQVALREALEETGIRGLTLHPTAPRPFDVDIHPIPAFGQEPAHAHLDLRYLVIAPAGSELKPHAGETRKIRFFGWKALPPLGLDSGLERALRKARAIFRK